MKTSRHGGVVQCHRCDPKSQFHYRVADGLDVGHGERHVVECFAVGVQETMHEAVGSARRNHLDAATGRDVTDVEQPVAEVGEILADHDRATQFAADHATGLECVDNADGGVIEREAVPVRSAAHPDPSTRGARRCTRGPVTSRDNNRFWTTPVPTERTNWDASVSSTN